MTELITRQQLAERWHCKSSSVGELEAEGKITRVGSAAGSPPGILYRMSDILIYEGGGDASPMAPWERKRLKTRIEELEAANAELVKQLQAISVAASMGISAAFKVPEWRGL